MTSALLCSLEGRIVVLSAILLLFFAAVTDIRAREIPDWISGAFVLLGLLMVPVLGWHGIVGGAVIFCVFFVLWLLRLIGGGDVKLIAASSLLFSPSQQLWYIFHIAIAGGVLAAVYLAFRGRLRVPSFRRFGRAVRVECWRIRRGAPLPYAIGIASGFVWTIGRNL